MPGNVLPMLGIIQITFISVVFIAGKHTKRQIRLSLVFLLISNLTNELRLHQFLGTKTTEVPKN